MHQTSKKEQKPPFLPLQHAPITLTGGNLYAVSSVPDCQTARPITYLHTHDSAEFGICLEGNGVFMIGGRIFPFRGGDCTFIPAWLPHLAQSAAHTVSRWYWLSLDTARLLVWAPELADLDCFHGEGTPSLFPAETHPEENRLIAELFDIVRSPDRAYVARRLSAVLALFVLCYPRIFAVTFDETFSRATGVHTQAYNMLLAVLTAVTIVLGMRMMGALLISSLIIFPALTAMRVFGTFRSVTICAAVVSVVNFLLGMVLSYVLETPSGASVVVVDLVVFLLFCGVQRIQCRVKK